MAVLGTPKKAAQSMATNAYNTQASGTPYSQSPIKYSPVNNGLGTGVRVAYNTPVHNGRQIFDANYASVITPPNSSQADQSFTGFQGSAYAQNPAAYRTQPTGNQPVQPTNTQQQNPMGGYGANVQTSIQPKGVYPEWMTNVAVNQVQAQADQASNVPYLMKMFDRPGVSRSDATMGAIAPIIADKQVQAQSARAQIPFQDELANQKNLFMGQVARENEGLGLGNLAARIAEMNQQNTLANQSRYSNLLSSLIG